MDDLSIYTLVVLVGLIFMFHIYLFKLDCKFHADVHFISCISWFNSHFLDPIYCMADPPWIIAEANILSSLSCFSYVFDSFKDLNGSFRWTVFATRKPFAAAPFSWRWRVATRIGRYEFVPSFPLDVPSPKKLLACISFRPRRSSETSWMIENGIFVLVLLLVSSHPLFATLPC